MVYSKYGSAIGERVGDGSAISAVELEVGLSTVIAVLGCSMVDFSPSLAFERAGAGCDIKVLDGMGVVRASGRTSPGLVPSRGLPGPLVVFDAGGKVSGVEGEFGANLL